MTTADGRTKATEDYIPWGSTSKIELSPEDRERLLDALLSEYLNNSDGNEYRAPDDFSPEALAHGEEGVKSELAAYTDRELVAEALTGWLDL